MDRVPLAFAVFLVVAAVAGVGGPATRGASAADDPTTLASTQDFDSVEFHVTVYENGSARWTIIYKQNLANESERENFRTFAKDFNTNDTQLWQDFKSRARALTAKAENTTGRDMSATGFRKHAEISDFNRNLGIVRMSFLWTNAAQTDGKQVILSDIFEGGLYIGPNQRLVVERGENLAFQSVTPPPDATSSETVTWEGERSFSDRRPKVVFGPPGSGNGPPTTPTDTTNGGGNVTPPGLGGFGGWPLLVLALLVIGGFAAIAYRTGALGGENGSVNTDNLGSDGGDGGAAATEASTAAGGAETEPAISDEELLSDEDRVLEMLESRGGRMKQVNIVEETGWSKSKVSMLLSEMEEDDQVSKLRIGRENVISLPGEEPEAAGSPFDDEE